MRENHEIRVIPLEERPHGGPADSSLARRFAGPLGRTDTLVIETTNFNGTGGFRGSGRLDCTSPNG